MAVSDGLVKELRGLVGEPTDERWTDEDLRTEIAKYPRLDRDGRYPQVHNGVVWVLNPDWIETYDLNRAAANLWQKKAAPRAGDYDYSADGGNFQRSQRYEQAMKMARYYNARRAPSVWRVR